MKFPSWLKYVVWVILLAVVATFIGFRFNTFMSGEVSAIDIVVFLVGVALLLIPLFQEVEIFGIKLKKELEKFKSEVRNELISIRSDITNSVNISPQFTSNVNLPQLASDEQLETIALKLQEIVDARLKPEEKKIKMKTKVYPKKTKTEIPTSAEYLFKVRYEIEKEIRRILEKIGYDPTFFPLRGVLNLVAIQEKLSKKINIDKNLIDALNNVILIADLAIHGESISKEQQGFVEDVYPDIIAYLRKLP
ncbi:hypothetical protein GF359_05745 [candidate division WOR-3 bacterium]|uniref:DUF4145 domain-containing protein n=1 Tax=candidate division WOR-3 bacterium TaxID=2052148 RepID=A0A9D5K9M2_UNCW3|nr:hypothetical protein [candidate division WOR-3 bacterium]MBD3364700.1 hypothetical protein [candidate division WOR-3 bacterium]